MEASSLPQSRVGGPGDVITIHILCQSLPPPKRFTLQNVSLSATVAQIKERIEQTFPGNPRASTQRLIYRGKPLRAEDAILGNILSRDDFTSSDSIHLVLPPEPTKTEKPPVASEPSQTSFMPETLSQTPAQASSINVQSGARASATTPGSSFVPGFSRPSSGTNTPSYTAINPFMSSSTPSPFQTSAHSANAENGELAQPIRRLRSQIERFELQVDMLFVPSMDDIIRTRTELLEIQDTRHARRLPAPGVAELVGRILNVQQRARLLDSTILQRSSQAGTPVGPAVPGSSNIGTANTSPLYMLSSPSGEQSIILTPNAVAPQFPTIHPTIPSHAVPGVEPLAELPGPNAAEVQNAVRQAMLNRPNRGNNIEHNGLARHMRRIWLFTRLWFFCYLTTAPGTWRRYISVTLALVVTFLSETDIPQRIFRSVISPAQRHLEGLAHAGGPLDPSAHAANNAPGVGIWDQFRRLERSIVLLLASLVPGLGERQVQARHAAERAREAAEQERIRQEEEAAAAAREPSEQPAQNEEIAAPGGVEAVAAGAEDQPENAPA
ncbi:hypothetical protein N7541_002509 [Penicillium brevicompactum]|uniref:Ubiquitin-like domain-containing protein n=1 Tax=Penicillium brevicompactum TaxID=5074 RepID=A0A9W9RLC5_PENBR|nr:hypothetical protein N7541_002509 [Penicillium brevicompactum]